MTEHRLRERWKQEDETAVNAAFDALLKHTHGRKLLWWLLQIGQVGRQPFANNALQTAFTCGELNVGQQVLDKITSVSPEGYLAMMKEMADERTRRDSELVRSRTERSDNAPDPDGPDSGADGDTGGTEG
jgi:hypothetical protein